MERQRCAGDECHDVEAQCHDVEADTMCDFLKFRYAGLSTHVKCVSQGNHVLSERLLPLGG